VPELPLSGLRQEIVWPIGAAAACWLARSIAAKGAGRHADQAAGAAAEGRADHCTADTAKYGADRFLVHLRAAVFARAARQGERRGKHHKDGTGSRATHEVPPDKAFRGEAFAAVTESVFGSNSVY
jgi:hypothetical protein